MSSVGCWASAKGRPATARLDTPRGTGAAPFAEIPLWIYFCFVPPLPRSRAVLTASESDGSPVLERYAPCPLCAARVQRNAARTPELMADPCGGGEVHLFNMEGCALAAVAGESIACPRGPARHTVPLQELVPELFMTDFPAR